MADATLHQVDVLTREGQIVQRYGSPDLPLKVPAMLSHLEGGGMAVWDKQTGELWTYSFPENRFTPQPLIPGLQCIADSPAVIYCAGEDNREVMKYQSGKMAARYDLKDDPHARIGKIALGPEQTIYLTDTGGKRLLSLTADLQLKHRFSLYEGLFIRPTRFAFSFNGSALWLIDEGREELLHFTLHSAVTRLEHGLLGEEYLALSQHEPALQELNTALQLGYRTPEIYLLLGQALYGLKHYSEALATFSQAQGTGATSYFWQGNALFHLGRYENALTAFQAALAREPDNEWVQFNMAQTLLALNRFPQAETIFRTLVQRAPDNFQARLGLGRSLLSGANATGAIRVLTELVTDKHVGREARHYLGLAYLQAGSSEQALPLLERAAQEGPHFKEALSALADIYRRSGNTERAQFYEQQVKTLKQSMEPSDAFPLKETL